MHGVIYICIVYVEHIYIQARPTMHLFMLTVCTYVCIDECALYYVYTVCMYPVNDGCIDVHMCICICMWGVHTYAYVCYAALITSYKSLKIIDFHNGLKIFYKGLKILKALTSSITALKHFA